MHRTLTSGFSVCVAFCLVSAASAQVVTVTIPDDVVDIDWQSATIDDLPGPDGEVSLSEALIAANNTPGHQTIGFAIPRDRWTLQFLYPGCAVLQSLTGYFLRASDEVTIDGTTQTAFTGDTNPEGWEVVLYNQTLRLNATNCTLIGFHSTNVSLSGTDGRIEGNTGRMNIDLFSGGGSLIHGNSAGTIKIDRSSRNVITANTVQRIRVLGGGVQQLAEDNLIGGPDPADRNFITGYGTWNSEGLPAGHAIQLAWAGSTVIQNNSIGTTPDGMEQGNLACTQGIGFESENFNTVIRENRIAGILGHGQGPHHAGQLFGWAILIGGGGTGVVIEGNTIGLNANGEPLLGSVTGIDAGSYQYGTWLDVRIGGAEPGQGNVIAGHRLDGVVVGREMRAARITGNSIYANGALGIDLIPTSFVRGVSQNDPLDADTGGNGVQNFPILESAVTVGQSLRVVGALATFPRGTFRIEFFASPACDGSGHGEGQVYLGHSIVSTDSNGEAAFDVMLPGQVSTGWVLTSTATFESLGATSEFSPCVEVREGALLTVTGVCPGRTTISWSRATPNQPMGIAYARTRGSALVPTGPCAGTRLGLGSNQLRLVAQVPTGPVGMGEVSGLAGSGACGGWIQLVIADGTPCTTSNVAQVP